MHNKLLSPFVFIYYFHDVIFMFPISILISQSAHVNFRMIFIALILLVVFSNILSYFFFRYSILKDQVVIQKGVFVKKTIHIPFSRIQSIQHNQFFLLKPFNIESIKIETAGRTSEEGNELKAVNVTIGDYLEQRHHEYLHPHTSDELATETKVDVDTIEPKITRYTSGIKDIALFSITDFKVFYFIIFVIIKTGNEFIDSIIHSAINNISHMSLALVVIDVITGIILAQLLIIAYYVIKYFDFTLSKEDSYLEIEMGLLSRNKLKVATKRIQSVLVKQNIAQKWLKICTFRIVLATDDSSKKDNGKDLALALPTVPVNKIEKRFHEYFDWISLRTFMQVKPTIRSWWIFTRNMAWIALIPLITMIFVENEFKWICIGIALILLLLVVGNAHFKYVSTQVSLSSDDKEASLVISTSRLWSKQQYHVGWHQIQSMRIRQSIWMKMNKLAHIEVIVRSGMTGKTITAKYLPFNDAQKVYDWYRQ